MGEITLTPREGMQCQGILTGSRGDLKYKGINIFRAVNMLQLRVSRWARALGIPLVGPRDKDFICTFPGYHERQRNNLSYYT